MSDFEFIGEPETLTFRSWDASCRGPARQWVSKEGYDRLVAAHADLINKHSALQTELRDLIAAQSPRAGQARIVELVAERKSLRAELERVLVRLETTQADAESERDRADGYAASLDAKDVTFQSLNTRLTHVQNVVTAALSDVNRAMR